MLRFVFLRYVSVTKSTEHSKCLGLILAARFLIKSLILKYKIFAFFEYLPKSLRKRDERGAATKSWPWLLGSHSFYFW